MLKISVQGKLGCYELVLKIVLYYVKHLFHYYQILYLGLACLLCSGVGGKVPRGKGSQGVGKGNQGNGKSTQGIEKGPLGVGIDPHGVWKGSQDVGKDPKSVGKGSLGIRMDSKGTGKGSMSAV